MNELTLRKIKKELENIFSENCIEYINNNIDGIEIEDNLYLDIEYYSNDRFKPFVIANESASNEIEEALSNLNLTTGDIIYNCKSDDICETYNLSLEYVDIELSIGRFDDNGDYICIYKKECYDLILLTFKENNILGNSKEKKFLMEDLSVIDYSNYQFEDIPNMINIDIVYSVGTEYINSILKGFIELNL